MSIGWLLLKDLRLLARSRLSSGLLIVYPVAIALLIGLALSSSPAKPRVAIVDLGSPGEVVELGGERIPVASYYDNLLSQVSPLRVAGVATARAAVASGRALAALVIPPGIATRLSSGVSQVQVQVIYNGNALQRSLARSTIEAALARANLRLSRQIRTAASHELQLLLKGGSVGLLGSRRLLGLAEIPAMLEAVARKMAPGPQRAELQRVAEFAAFAAHNLNVSKRVLSAVGQPIELRSEVVNGRRTPLGDYAVVLAVSFSETLLCVLLGAGALALEREENALQRLVRSSAALVSRTGLLIEKVLLAAGCSLLVAFATLAGISAFVTLDWGRAALWLAALAAGAVSLGALGVALGALARDVRASALLAFMLVLPLAFLALVPAGSVAGGLYDVIRAISFVFPFKAALEALDCAVNESAPGLGISAVHLLVLALGFGVLARLGLRGAR